MSNTMTDGPGNGPGNGPGGGPPWAGPPNPLDGLRRSSDDRWIAGVAGGVARHFDIAPWIVRLAGIALAIVGIGVPIYLLGWILLPSDHRASIATEHGWNRNTVIAVCVLVVVASVAFLGTDGIGPSDHAFAWRLLPWLVIGAGVYLLVRSTTGHEPATAMASPPPPPTPTEEIIPVDSTSVTDPTTPFAPVPPWRPPVTQTMTPPRPPIPPRPRRSPFLTPLTLFVLIGLIGAAVVSGGHGWARPGTVAAISLGIIGAALILSAFLGRARGLIALGILVAVPLLVGIAVGPHWDDWHNRTYDPATRAQLHRTYDRGLGRTVLDLRDLTLPAGHVTHVRVDQIAGQLIVWLPQDARTHIEGHVTFGEIAYDRRPNHNGGTGVHTDRTLATGTGTGRLDLSVDLTAGQFRIHDDNARSINARSGGN